MNLKRLTSLIALLTFFCILLTSIILYIVPQGRVAYWSDWHLWGLSKEQWGAIHINMGFIFLITLCFHMYFNWKSILLYLKNKAKEIRIFTKEFTVAFIIFLVCIIGTYFEIPPFSTIISISNTIKDAAALKYGEPPYGHAELTSLKTFTDKMGIDLNKALILLRDAGYIVKDEKLTLQKIAQENKVSPQQLYLTMAPDPKKTAVYSGNIKSLPATPVPGTGNLTLADFCSQYNLNIKTILTSLKDTGITASADMTLKKISETNNISPIELYEKIKEIIINHKNITPKTE